MKKHRHIFVCSAIFALLAVTTTQAMMVYVPPSSVPVWRLIRHQQEWLDHHRSDPQAWYDLGRVHYLAFATDSPMMDVYRGTDEPDTWVDQTKWQPAHSKIPQIRPSRRELLNHAVQARRDIEEAIRLSPHNSLYRLTLACLMEQFHAWAISAKPDPASIPAEMRDTDIRSIRAHYHKALEVALESEKSLKEYFESTDSQESAEDIVRLAKDTSAPLSAVEKKQLAEAKRVIAHFEKLPHMVTPIVFSFRPAARISELLAPGHFVDFDLQGHGVREKWPWVRPDTGLLVWDPLHHGRITSGKELFGNYTFQLFWTTGYDALAALDDNSDGYLKGRELEGISVWFDRNGDGICTPDEVIPLRDLGITAIAARYEGYEGIHPTNP
ncbi:MAG TPA: hypothetical protein VG733_19570, partial [Chthoniobacteraceae bacterium]|nr:hypothetical protein [Chthoniobacteraceae bacterium]